MSVTVGLANSSLENWQNSCVLTERIYAERVEAASERQASTSPQPFVEMALERPRTASEGGRRRLQPAKRLSVQ